jgi:hypothetical protein
MFKTIRLLFNRENRAVTRALMAEATRRGVPVDHLLDVLTLEEKIELVESARPQLDLTPWGMMPRSALTDQRSSGIPSVEAAVAAAWVGEWRPAAEVVAESYGEWDYRAAAVYWLSEAATDNGVWLDKWLTARPDDRHAAAVACEAALTRAWRLRGERLAEDTTTEQFARFHRALPAAEAAAKHATRILPGDPTPWHTLINIGLGLDYGHGEFDRVWQNLVERAPLHRTGHESALQYWCAKWYGSHERMFAFAERAAEQSPSLSVLLVQAAFEKHFDDESVWRQSIVQQALDVLVHWLRTDGADSIRVREDLGWAAMALVDSGRGAEAVPLFQRLGSYAGGSPWRMAPSPAHLFHSYRVRACEAAR